MAIFSTSNLPANKNQSANPKHYVLLVDDEPSNLQVMSSLLREQYQILTAENGRIALDMIRGMGDKELCMIISDQRMPEMSGVELLEQSVVLRPQTMRLIVSGYSDMKAVLAAINTAKIFHFISKPYEPTEFVAIVHQAMMTYELQRKMTLQFEHMQQQLTTVIDADQRKEQQLQQALARLRALGTDTNV